MIIDLLVDRITPVIWYAAIGGGAVAGLISGVIVAFAARTRITISTERPKDEPPQPTR